MAVLNGGLHAAEWSPSALFEAEAAIETWDGDTQKLEAILTPQLEARRGGGRASPRVRISI